MKLKFKKQKIASLHLIQKIKGGNTDADHVAFTQPPNETETCETVCNISQQLTCTISLNPADCHTNDGTLKTWNSIIGEGARTTHC